MQGGRCEESGHGAAEPSEWVPSAVVCGCGGLAVCPGLVVTLCRN